MKKSKDLSVSVEHANRKDPEKETGMELPLMYKEKQRV